MKGIKKILCALVIISSISNAAYAITANENSKPKPIKNPIILFSDDPDIWT